MRYEDTDIKTFQNSLWVKYQSKTGHIHRFRSHASHASETPFRLLILTPTLNVDKHYVCDTFQSDQLTQFMFV